MWSGEACGFDFEVGEGFSLRINAQSDLGL
jgi:hypothetical protein